LTCSVIHALPAFPGVSTISSPSRFVVEGVFRKSGVVHSFEMVDPVLFVFGSNVLHSRDIQFFSYVFAAYLSSLVYPLTLLTKHISAATRPVLSRPDTTKNTTCCWISAQQKEYITFFLFTVPSYKPSIAVRVWTVTLGLGQWRSDVRKCS
jgi:hypothetical protein